MRKPPHEVDVLAPIKVPTGKWDPLWDSLYATFGTYCLGLAVWNVFLHQWAWVLVHLALAGLQVFFLFSGRRHRARFRLRMANRAEQLRIERATLIRLYQRLVELDGEAEAYYLTSQYWNAKTLRGLGIYPPAPGSWDRS